MLEKSIFNQMKLPGIPFFLIDESERAKEWLLKNPTGHSVYKDYEYGSREVRQRVWTLDSDGKLCCDAEVVDIESASGCNSITVLAKDGIEKTYYPNEIF